MKTLTLQFLTYFKTILREPSTVIWSLLWPILLTLFYLVAFSGIGQGTLDSFTVAIHQDNSMKEVFTDIEFIDTIFVEDDTLGLQLLYPEDSKSSRIDSNSEEEKEVNRHPIAYLDKDNILHYPTEQAGATELAILRSVTDSIASSRPLIDEAIKNGVSPLQIVDLIDFEQPIRHKSSIGEMNPMALSYLAVFGMVTLMGMFGTLDFVAIIQADKSAIGVRQTVSPIKKSRLILMALLSTFIFTLLSAVLLIFFVHFAVGIELLANFWLNILLLTLPILGNLALGIWIGTLPVNSNIKPGIAMAFMLGFSSLAGLMSPDMVFMLRKSAPSVLSFNPVYRLSQALIRVNILDRDPQLGTYGLFFLAYILLFFVGSVFVLRRQQFKSLARN